MNQGRRKAVRWVTMSLCAIFFCLPLFGFGMAYLNWWRLSKSADLYYFNFPYLRMASIYFAFALVASGATLYGGFRRSLGGLLLFVPPLLLLVGAILFPNAQPFVYRINDFNYMETVKFDCDEWSGAHHQYPASDTEMQEALRSTTRAKGIVENRGLRTFQGSQYRYRGELLPYQVVVETNAKGAHVSDVSKRPGIVYYRISPDSREYWITMTGLLSSTPGFANLLESNGHPQVSHKAIQGGWSRDEK